MKYLPLFAALFLPVLAKAEEKLPDVFDGIFLPNQPTRGDIGVIVPPAEIDKYIAKVEAAARQDRKWFNEYSANTKPGLPLPFHEKLGLTKEEYNEYLALWDQREFKSVEEVMLLLRKNSDEAWTITATGEASSLSTLRYHPKEDIFRSPNGTLTRLEDIQAAPTSVLGEWTGKEWKFEEETSLGKTKENIAVGTHADGKHCYLIYRVQELTSAGTRLLDKSLVIRFLIPNPTKTKE